MIQKCIILGYFKSEVSRYLINKVGTAWCVIEKYQLESGGKEKKKLINFETGNDSVNSQARVRTQTIIKDAL